NNFYRLKQIDFDGTATEDKIVVVNFDKYTSELYPNPAENRIFASSSHSLVNQVVAYDENGKPVLRKKINTNQTIEIDISNLQSGTYILNYITINQTVIDSKRFVKI